MEVLTPLGNQILDDLARASTAYTQGKLGHDKAQRAKQLAEAAKRFKCLCSPTYAQANKSFKCKKCKDGNPSNLKGFGWALPHIRGRFYDAYS
jgi:hypothetical protein